MLRFMITARVVRNLDYGGADGIRSMKKFVEDKIKKKRGNNL